MLTTTVGHSARARSIEPRVPVVQRAHRRDRVPNRPEDAARAIDARISSMVSTRARHRLAVSPRQRGRD
jgi:hypothetical protein